MSHVLAVTEEGGREGGMEWRDGREKDLSNENIIILLVWYR